MAKLRHKLYFRCMESRGAMQKMYLHPLLAFEDPFAATFYEAKDPCKYMAGFTGKVVYEFKSYGCNAVILENPEFLPHTRRLDYGQNVTARAAHSRLNCIGFHYSLGESGHAPRIQADINSFIQARYDAAYMVRMEQECPQAYRYLAKAMAPIIRMGPAMRLSGFPLESLAVSGHNMHFWGVESAYVAAYLNIRHVAKKWRKEDSDCFPSKEEIQKVVDVKKLFEEVRTYVKMENKVLAARAEVRELANPAHLPKGLAQEDIVQAGFYSKDGIAHSTRIGACSWRKKFHSNLDKKMLNRLEFLEKKYAEQKIREGEKDELLNNEQR